MFTASLEHRRIENCGQQLWEQQWTLSGELHLRDGRRTDSLSVRPSLRWSLTLTDYQYRNQAYHAVARNSLSATGNNCVRCYTEDAPLGYACVATDAGLSMQRHANAYNSVMLPCNVCSVRFAHWQMIFPRKLIRLY